MGFFPAAHPVHHAQVNYGRLQHERTAQIVTGTHLNELEDILGTELENNEILRDQHKAQMDQERHNNNLLKREIVASKNDLIGKDQIISEQAFQIRDLMDQNDALVEDGELLRAEMTENYRLYDVQINDLKIMLTNAQNHILKLENELDTQQRVHNDEVAKLAND
jgi:hypothetical protein